MKRLRLIPLTSPVNAEVSIPGSKSYTLRALFMAALTPGKVRIINPLFSDDTRAMIGCLSILGIEIVEHPGYLEILNDVSSINNKDYRLDADLSAVTCRFMLALACVIPGVQILDGKPALLRRPIGLLVDGLRQLGADIAYLDERGFAPVKVASNRLNPGTVHMPGAETSQYFSALLMIAPRVGEMTIDVEGELLSRPYIEMTIDTIQHFGISVTSNDHQQYRVGGGQQYKGKTYIVEGDVSSAGYFMAIAALTKSTITLKNMNPNSLQADMGFLKILETMGNKVLRGEDRITIVGKGVQALTTDMRNSSDQAQTMAVLAAFADGTTTISGVQSLRIKETERVVAVEQELKKMNIKTFSTKNNLIIHGGNPHSANIMTYGDHRMAMAFAVAGSKLDGMQIDNPEVVSKTFPDFWEKLASIGIANEEVQPNIVLIGMRGSGKTTIAKILAAQLGTEHLDIDHMMVKLMGMEVPTIVKKNGWTFFRDQEAVVASEISSIEDIIISTGGGIVLRSENIQALKKNGIVVYLRASADVLITRIGDAIRTPLTSAPSLKEEVEEVLSERQELYEMAADVIIDTDTLSPEAVADEIIMRLSKR